MTRGPTDGVRAALTLGTRDGSSCGDARSSSASW